MNETEHGLAKAFRAGLQNAATWLALMRVNGIRVTVQACQHDSLRLDKVGCRARSFGYGSACPHRAYRSTDPWDGALAADFGPVALLQLQDGFSE